MIEFFKHTFGLCGEHWHPNFITALASSPLFLAPFYYIKCKCGEWFGKHKSDCKNDLNIKITQEDIDEDIRNCSNR